MKNATTSSRLATPGIAPVIPTAGLKDRSGRALPFLADEPREHPTGDAVEILGTLARECQLRGITPEVAEDGSVDLNLTHVDGYRLCVGPYDSAADALDDIRKMGRCHDCRSEVDDTAAPYADKWLHIDGSPVRICRVCRGREAAVALDGWAQGLKAETEQAKDPVLALEQVIAALPTAVPEALKRTVPSASDETAALLVTDIAARLQALRA